jgi:hypothetical protein
MVSGSRSSERRPSWDPRQERRSADADGAIVTHNTLSTDATHVQVFYPFHSLYGYSLRVLRRPKRGEGAVLVLDSAGKRLKIPVWMLLPEAAHFKITEQAHLSKESLLHLTLLFQQWNALGDSDNLLPPSIDGGKKGHHAAATTVTPKPNRRGTRARRGDSKSRTGRSDGAHSGDSFPNRTKESE